MEVSAPPPGEAAPEVSAAVDEALGQLLALWGQRVRDVRLARGRTQQQLAATIGVSASQLSGWEAGRHAPSLERQLALARALDVHPADLFPMPDEIVDPDEIPA